MNDELEKACLLLDVDSALVVKHEYRDADFIILADHGIGGIKRYSVPIIELRYVEPVALEEKPLQDLTVAELRVIANLDGLDIPNRALKADIIAAIEGKDEEE